MKKQPLTILLFLGLFVYSCGEVQQNQEQESETTETESYVSESTYEVEEEQQGFENGRHTATVYYSNSETGYSTTYTLDVEVEDNEVTIIYFESGGYLDSDHIQPAELDESGNATIYGEGGKTYEVQLTE